MRPRSKSATGPLARSAVMVFVAAANAAYGVGAERADRTRYLKKVLDIVDERLDDPKCKALFDHWKVERGDPRRVRYVNGSNQPICRGSQVVAATMKGEPRTYLCFPQFDRVMVQDPSLAAVYLIHEYLHSQGLGESPRDAGAPTAREITLSVVERCGQ
jgi:hypothetical protein